MMKRIGWLVLVGLSLNWNIPLFAQSTLLPIHPPGLDLLSKAGRQHQTQGLDTLALPFWDDFSNGILDESLWPNSSNVEVSTNKGINVPSLYAATLDGIDNLGLPYDATSNEVGLTDELTSQPIDLDAVSNVRLSFWWQSGGNVDSPEEIDSLRLQFRSQNGVWYTGWSDAGVRSKNEFQQENIGIPDSLYYKGFQFRFQSFGNRSGQLDAWHLDYVYLNNNRNATDNFVPDLAISAPPSRPFVGYSAVPLKRFLADTMSFAMPSSVMVNNLNNSATTFEYKGKIKDEITGVLIDDLGTFIGQSIAAGQRKTIVANSLNSQKLLDHINANDTIDVFNLETVFELSTSDPGDFQGAIDLKINDTTSMSYVLSDYYAYDDGVAEFEYGVRVSGTQIAYQYIIDEPGTLTHLDINFRNLNGASIDLIVWNRINVNSNFASEVHRQAGALIKSDDITKPARYSISPVAVADTFYIGFELNIDNVVFLGFDKNYDSGEKIHINTAGIWSIDNASKGSLLLRPVFADTETLLGIEKRIFRKFVNVFPNPANSHITVSGKHIAVKIVDSSGRELYFRENSVGVAEQKIDISYLKPGLYSILIYDDESFQTEKIIIDH